ncbi:hypothetical protein OC842_006205 [Tilletia horrida]|uniref:Uncharacterized protein n=1 Tax=Tilletia horrida TaxID=155126 RepID=A0AAN6G7P5_9BASI|nr:hypothetical protein OC842_006205 [Tilletia horrida]
MTFEDEALDRVDLLAIAAVCKQLRAPRDIPVTRARELLRLFQHNEHMTSHVKYFRLRNDKAEHGDGATAQSSRHGTWATPPFLDVITVQLNDGFHLARALHANPAAQSVASRRYASMFNRGAHPRQDTTKARES